MVSAAVASKPAGPPVTGGTVAFFYGSNQYVEKFATFTQQQDATQHEVVSNINPGGFLRGVRCEFRSTGGVLGTGTVSPDGPWSLCASATLENLDGAPIIYPMNGFAHKSRQKYMRPWWGDPDRRYDFSNSINPSGTLFLQPELRHTAGVLANTDARAQYRIRWTFATLTQFMTTVGTATAPTVTLTLYLETWAQPDAEDLLGNEIEGMPPGLNLRTLSRQQILNLSAAGADNTFQAANMGNENRGFIWIMRDSNNVRTDLASDPIRWRLDNRSLGVFSQQELFNKMNDFYDHLQYGSTRDAGVYVFTRFYQPGKLVGEPWLPTTNATFNIWETATAAGGTSGTNQIISDEVVPAGRLPLELESI